jgi:phosphatidylinositol dimannoside acyltransferase
MVVGVHTSNFDLLLQWLCKGGLKLLVLTIPDPRGGRRKEYEMRKASGMNLVIPSVATIRQTVHYLQQGGAVLTGIDRPIPDPKARPMFFGRPAALPLHHIFLASKAQVPLVLLVTSLEADGKYHLNVSDPIELEPHPDREKAELLNAEKVLAVAEGFIRQMPEQWSESLAVWPETLDLAPR